jgi:hypothetical protein
MVKKVQLPPDWSEMTDAEKGAWLSEHEIGSEDRKRLNIDIKVESKTLLEALKRQNQLETELEDSKGKLRIAAERLLANKKEKVGCNDPDVDTPSKLKVWIAEHKNETNYYYEPPVGHGSSGNLKLSSAQGESNREFDSKEEMIDFLVNQKHTGTPEQKEQAEKVLNELYRKTFQGLKEGSGQSGKTLFKDPLKDGKSIIRHALDRRNEQLRK